MNIHEVYRLPFKEYLGTTLPGIAYFERCNDIAIVFAWEEESTSDPWRVAVRFRGVWAERRTSIDLVHSERLYASASVCRIDESPWIESIDSCLKRLSKYGAAPELRHYIYWDEDIGLVEVLAREYEIIGPERGLVVEADVAWTQQQRWIIARRS
jgi:hypothetical protein